jgi:hypothetical protein
MKKDTKEFHIKKAEDHEDLALKAEKEGDIDSLERNLNKAEKIWFSLEMKKRAAEMYESFKHYSRAIELYKTLGKKDKVKKLKKLREQEKPASKMMLEISPLILGLASFGVSIFLLSERFTGNIIFNLEDRTVDSVGILFFLIALAFLINFFWGKQHLLKDKNK